MQILDPHPTKATNIGSPSKRGVSRFARSDGKETHRISRKTGNATLRSDAFTHKFVRRVNRRIVMSSPVDQKLAAIRLYRQKEIRRLADNVHEYKRLVVLDRAARLESRALASQAFASFPHFDGRNEDPVAQIYNHIRL